MLADFFTKSLQGLLFWKFCDFVLGAKPISMLSVKSGLTVAKKGKKLVPLSSVLPSIIKKRVEEPIQVQNEQRM